jgi:hypothetical protein
MMENDAQERLRALLEPLPIDDTLFPPTSRYHGIGTAVWDPDGDRPVRYLLRRLVPQPDHLADISVHVVVDRERPDQVAFEEYGDPEFFWRLCDGNRVVFPDELVAELGRRIRVTGPKISGGGAP